MAPQVGLEPTTLRLTAGCSAIELLRSVARHTGEARRSSCLFIISFDEACENRDAALRAFTIVTLVTEQTAHS